MRRTILGAFLYGLLILPSLAQATPFDLNDLLRRHNGTSVTDGTQGILNYSADTQRLLYVSDGSFRMDTRDGGRGEFTGIFSWQAPVSSQGRILQPGTMSWFGDVGSGTELLATGVVRRIVFDHLDCFAQPDPSESPVPFCNWGTPSALIRATFLHSALSDLGQNMLSLVSVSRAFAPNPPFRDSFSCGSSVIGCNYFSDSVIAGLNVSEPDTSMLFGLCLLGLSFVVGRRRAASLLFGRRR